MGRLAITLDGARSAMQAAWREKRLGYQLQVTGFVGCWYRYHDAAGNVIGCCAAGAFIPDDLLDERAFSTVNGLPARLPRGERLTANRHLFDAADDAWLFVTKAQELHDAAVNWWYDEENAAIARADFERHIGVDAEAVPS